jgi:FSR family fosmidomycin resistance protein-like MFS transporter
VIALSGAIATFIGGRIADKLGFRKMIRVGLMALVPCMFILAMTRSVLISLIVLVPAAVALNLAYSPSVVLGQKLLPNHIGFASGVTMGLASSIGGLFSPILGRVADTQGVDVVMWIMFVICVVAAVSTVILPEDPDLKVKNS